MTYKEEIKVELPKLKKQLTKLEVEVDKASKLMLEDINNKQNYEAEIALAKKRNKLQTRIERIENSLAFIPGKPPIFVITYFTGGMSFGFSDEYVEHLYMGAYCSALNIASQADGFDSKDMLKYTHQAIRYIKLSKVKAFLFNEEEEIVTSAGREFKSKEPEILSAKSIIEKIQDGIDELENR